METTWSPGFTPEIISCVFVPGEQLSNDDGDAPRFISARGGIDPITIVQVEDCRSWDGCMGFFFCPRNVAVTDIQEKRTYPRDCGFLDANFGGADIRIEDRTDIADGAFNDLIGIGIEADVGENRPSDVVRTRSFSWSIAENPGQSGQIWNP